MIEDPIRIGDKEFKFADLTPGQQECVTFITNIDDQLNSMHKNMLMLQAARETFFNRLNESINEKQVSGQNQLDDSE